MQHFNALVVRDGITREDTSLDPRLVHDMLLTEAEKILLADVFGEIEDDDDINRLLEEE